jgi:hypothetical protein
VKRSPQKDAAIGKKDVITLCGNGLDRNIHHLLGEKSASIGVEKTL